MHERFLLPQGFCSRAQTPTERGFDSFFGFYLDHQDHFSHVGPQNGYDFRFNHAVYSSAAGHYSTHLYTRRVQQIIGEYKVIVREEEREGGGEQEGDRETERQTDRQTGAEIETDRDR